MKNQNKVKQLINKLSEEEIKKSIRSMYTKKLSVDETTAYSWLYEELENRIGEALTLDFGDQLENGFPF